MGWLTGRKKLPGPVYRHTEIEHVSSPIAPEPMGHPTTEEPDLVDDGDDGHEEDQYQDEAQTDRSDEEEDMVDNFHRSINKPWTIGGHHWVPVEVQKDDEDPDRTCTVCGAGLLVAAQDSGSPIFTYIPPCPSRKAPETSISSSLVSLDGTGGTV